MEAVKKKYRRVNPEVKERIARNIRHLRKLKFEKIRGGSQKMAALLDVSPQQYSPWETGKRTPSDERLDQIAKILGVSAQDLKYTEFGTPPEMPAADQAEDSQPATQAIPGAVIQKNDDTDIKILVPLLEPGKPGKQLLVSIRVI